MVADVSMITRQRRSFQVLAKVIPQSLFDWVNKVYTHRRGRSASRQRLREEYDQATAKILRTLDSVAEEDFKKSAVYPGWDPLLSGETTLVQLFHYVKAHFQVHEQQIRTLL
jgi:hypothetical protein